MDGTRSWIINNNQDIVTHLPPPVVVQPSGIPLRLYEHVDSQYLIEFNAGGIVANHDLANYMSALNCPAWKCP